MRARSGALLLAVATLTACSGTGGPEDDADPGATRGTAGHDTAASTTGDVAPTTSEAAPSTGDAAPTTDDVASTTGDTAPTTEHPDEVSIAFVGDVMLARTVGERIVDGDPGDPFAGVADQFAAADLVVGTLETTVGERGDPEDKTYTFQAPPEAVDSLVAGGFDLVALANNHSYDYGAEGLLETVELLDDGGVAHVGAGEDAEAARAPVTLSEGGLDTAFLAYVDVPDDWTGYRNRDWAATASDPGVAWAVPEDIASDVAAAGDTADHVIVLLHAGTEGSAQPDPSQHAAADAALDAGATAVIGSHPHVLQGHRLEDGRLTAWSLGNFVFDGFSDPESTQSVVLTVHLDREGIIDTEWTPVHLQDSYPQALDPDSPEGRAVLEHLESLPAQR